MTVRQHRPARVAFFLLSLIVAAVLFGEFIVVVSGAVEQGQRMRAYQLATGRFPDRAMLESGDGLAGTATAYAAPAYAADMPANVRVSNLAVSSSR